MSSLSALFSELKTKNEAALVTFLVAGDPDLETSFANFQALAEGGADIIELGLPFSDPLADGKVIQEACQRALAHNTTPEQTLTLVRKLREKHSTGIVLFSCFNLLQQYGLEAFAAQAADAGVDGILVTDLPPEEAADWLKIAGKHELDTIFLLAPTSRPERISQIAESCTGFLYCISRMGVTGTKEELPTYLSDYLAKVRALTNLPLGVGFGISTPEQVRQISQIAEAVVIGSALVEKARQSTPQQLTQFVRSLKTATKKTSPNQ
jgi:tryptophan synthase alpha chain